MRRAVLLVPILLAGGCSLLGGKKKDATTEQVWTRFNSDDDVVTIEVTAEDEPLGEPFVADLHSSTGTVVVGSVTISPGSGPVGTEHDVYVDIELGEDTENPWYDLVDKVEVEADAGDRGTWTIELDHDSADRGRWWRKIRSYGDEGEVRTDVFTFSLWQLEDALPEDAAVQE